MLPKTKKEAKFAGSKFYFTGEPCNKGHIDKRYVSDGSCVSCTLVRANKRYVTKKSEILVKLRNSYKNNPDKIKGRVKARREAEPEKVKAEKRAEYHRHKQQYIERATKWRRHNPEKVRRFVLNWFKNNPVKANNYSVLRRARLKDRLPSWLTEAQHGEMKDIYRKAREMSLNTDIKYHVDHIVPLCGANVSGLHVPWNLQILTAFENHSKNNRYES